MVEYFWFIFFYLILVDQVLYGEGIAVDSEAADDSAACWGEERVVSVVFASEDIAQMDFYCGCRYGGYCVVECDTGVAVSASVDDDAVGWEADLVDAVDELAFDVALEVAYLYIWELLAEVGMHLPHCCAAVDVGLP